jgi:hypothetical protein
MNNKLRLWLPSFADVIFCCCFIRLTLSSDSWLLNDADTGYHIRAGEYILSNFMVPKRDIFSYIAPPLPWIAHEWLSEVIMALVHRFSGLTGIVIFFAFLIGVAYSLLFRFSQSIQCNFVLTALLVLLATVSSSIHWLARPHIFSLLLTIGWYAILDNYQHKEKNYLYALPLLMLLWVNLHGGFIIGFVLLAVYFTGNLIPLPWAAGYRKQIGIEKCKNIAIVALASLLLSLLNPRGYSILLFPFSMVSNRFIMENVTEFLSPNFHAALPFLYILLLAIGVLAVSRTSLHATEVILVLLFTYMSLYSARYIPLFGIVITPILLRRIQPGLENSNTAFANFFRQRSKNLELTDASARGHLWPIISVLVVFALALNGNIAFKFDRMIKPVAAAEFLKREKITGNMFNDDEFGDYLIYAAWPQYKVFFDGRSDMYGEAWGQQYLRIANVQPGWEKVIAKNHITWIFSGASSPLSAILLEKANWQLVYADPVAKIFVNKIPEYQFLMTKYADVKPVEPNEN